MRRRMFRAIAPFYDYVQNIIIPHVEENQFGRYVIQHIGWKWFFIPTFKLRQIETIDLKELTTEITYTARRKITTRGQEWKNAIVKKVNGTVTKYLNDVENFVSSRLQEIILGAEKIPSLLVSKGSTAISHYQRSVLEAVGTVGSNTFVGEVRKHIGQMAIYAREEALGNPTVRTMLPVGTRFVHATPRQVMYVIEEKPRVHTIRIGKNTHQLSYPYIVFVLYILDDKFDQMQIFFRNSPLTDLDNGLGVVPMPNVMVNRTHDGNVSKRLKDRFYLCFPSKEITGRNHVEIAASAIEVYWSSRFRNDHWDSSMHDYIPNNENFVFDGWLALTKNKPESILGINWINSGLTIAKLVMDLNTRASSPDIKDNVRRLDRHVADLGPRIAVAIQEKVLEVILAKKDVAEAKRLFLEAIKTAIEEGKLGEEIRSLFADDVTRKREAWTIPGVFEDAVAEAADAIVEEMIACGNLIVPTISKRLKQKG